MRHAPKVTATFDATGDFVHIHTTCGACGGEEQLATIPTEHLPALAVALAGICELAGLDLSSIKTVDVLSRITAPTSRGRQKAVASLPAQGDRLEEG
jgi:hypothetical protein